MSVSECMSDPLREILLLNEWISVRGNFDTDEERVGEWRNEGKKRVRVCVCG